MASGSPSSQSHLEEHPLAYQKVVDGLSYSLNIVQQPVRARMCGFGDKDRRNVTPAPILQLIVKTSNGEIVPTSKLMDRNFVVTADLWHDDGMSERNLVKAPAHLDPVNSLGEQHQQQHSHSLGITPTFTTDMATMHLSRMSGRTSRKDSQDEMHDQGEDDGLEQESSGHESPCEFTGKQRASESFREAVDSLKISGVSQERLATSFPTSNQIGLPTSDNPPVSPATLSANVAVASTFSSPMSQVTQSSDQTLTETSHPRRTLRSGRRLSTAMTTRSTSSSWNLSDEGDTIAMDTDASQGEERELHAHLNTEANVQSDGHTMNTVGEDYQGVSRPSPRQGEGSLHHHHQSSQQESVGGSDLPIDEADAQGQYIRNLVGGVVVYGQQATDLDNEPQVWFAFSTISIRTEGYFRIRFRLTEIGSQDEPQRVSPILYALFSDIIHVQSPKRFGGTFENNKLAAHLNKQGIKVPTRKDEKRIINRTTHDDSTYSRTHRGGPSGAASASTTSPT